MKGAIIGDIIGSAFIEDRQFNTNFQLLKPNSSFTENTILTIATADATISNSCLNDAIEKWLSQYPEPFRSSDLPNLSKKIASNNSKKICNDAARRINSIGFLSQSLEQAIETTEISARSTHKQPHKINAAKAVSATVYLAKSGATKKEIKNYIENTFHYNLNQTMDDLRTQELSQNFQSLAPAAIVTFLLSHDYEDAIRKAISIGGPCSNTAASITGGIAYAYYKHIPKSIIRKAFSRLTPKMEQFIDSFENLYLWNESQNSFLMNVH